MGKWFIAYLIDEEGKKVYERRGINTLATNYYRKLYAKEHEYGEITLKL